MFNFKTNKLLTLLLMISALCLLFTGCGKKEVLPEDMVDVLLITDVGTVDDGSYNQGAWDGIEEYAAENPSVITKYYQPSEATEEAYLEQINNGVDNGAKLIVCPGSLMEETIYKAQKTYKDVNFILLDGTPHNEDYSDETISDNVCCISFEEEEAGFLAGYAAVRDGYTNLGFIGGVPDDAVIQYGYGFVQGADYASIQIGLPISVKYMYSNTYYEDDSVETTAGSWYDEGCEVIFACGGAMGKSVMRAAEDHNGKVIGVDVDQSGESETVITSAMKSLDSAVYQEIKDYYSQNFSGGQELTLSAKESGVCLPMATSRFNTFSETDYESIYEQLVDDIIDPYADTGIGTCEELSLVNTQVTYIVP